MQRYDTTIQHNLAQDLLEFIEHFIGLDMERVSPLPTRQQFIAERIPDFLGKVWFPGMEASVIQIEIQPGNDQEMAWRMQEYNALIARRYKCPVRQFVVYLGSAKMTMKNEIRDGKKYFCYDLLDLSTIPFQDFLRSESIALVVWGVLGNYGKASPEEVVGRIIQKVKEMSGGNRRYRDEHLQTLKTFCRLRNLDTIVEQINIDMPLEVDMEGSVWGKKIAEICLQRGKIISTMNLFVEGAITKEVALKHTEFSQEKFEIFLKAAQAKPYYWEHSFNWWDHM